MWKVAWCLTIAVLFWVPLVVQAEPRAGSIPSQTQAPSSGADPIAEADGLFAYGEDRGRDRQALSIIEGALETRANEYQLLWRAARVYYHVGDDAETGEKGHYFERGIAAGQRAVALQPTGVEGHFWLGANYGGLSEVQGMIRAFQMIKHVRAEMETALRLQASYEDGGAYLALGELDRQLPRLFGGSVKRAIAYLEQGLRVAPQNMAMRLALAEAYLDAGRRDDGHRLLLEILHLPVLPARARANRATQEKARQLLSK
jgi:hypothetical protein